MIGLSGVTETLVRQGLEINYN